MLKIIAAASFAALVAAAPPPSFAQSTETQAEPAHKPTGSYRSQMRARHNMHKQRSRAGAEHMRQMRMQKQQ